MRPSLLMFTAVLGLSFGLTYLFTPLMRALAPRVGMLDRPGGRKSHADPTPLLGGVAVFVGIWGTLLVAVQRGWIDPGGQLKGIFLGSLLVVGMGLVDDALGLSPITKFLVQVLGAAVVVWHGVVVSLFIGTNWVTVVLTLIWIVGVTNSFNLLDNMDGLTCGVGAICALIFSLIAYRQHDPHTLLISLTIMGSLVGFLRFNFSPASIFLGDAGSEVVGFLLACLAVSANYIENSQLQQLPVITPLLVFGVPLFDTFSVMAIRWVEGRPLWEPDNRHFSHRLVALGMTPRAAVLMVYLVTLTVGNLAILLSRVNLAGAILLLIDGLAILGIIVLLEYTASVPSGTTES